LQTVLKIVRKFLENFENIPKEIEKIISKFLGKFVINMEKIFLKNFRKYLDNLRYNFKKFEKF
jgi:hypothetical protein